MAGIDNNTLLYLRGDSFTDLSLNPKTIINNGITISDSGIFSKSLDFTSTNNATVTLPTFLDNPFTVDWYEYDIGNGTNGQISTIFTNVIKNSSGSNYNNYGFAIITNSVDGDNVLDLSTVPNSTWDICTNKSIGNDRPKQWVHRSIVYDGTNVRSYENGIKYMEFNLNGKKILSTYNTFQFNRWRENTTYPSWRYVKNFRISNVVRYTEDFTPPTKPYNSITINKTNQTDTNIEFNIEKLGQETINKVEVLVNGTVSETYADSYNNIDYLIDTELCAIGNNNITIRVTFDDIYTEELSLTHTYAVDELPLKTPLLNTVERVKLLTNSKQNEKAMLSNILASKNVEVAEEDKMSDLIGKVGELPSMVSIAKLQENQEIIENKISILEGENEKLKIEQEQQNEEILVNMLANTEMFEMILGMMPMTLSIEDKNTKNNGGNSMIEVYCTLIIKNVKTIEDVPLVIREQVIERLKQLEVPVK